jgi:hypothetical protein
MQTQELNVRVNAEIEFDIPPIEPTREYAMFDKDTITDALHSLLLCIRNPKNRNLFKSVMIAIVDKEHWPITVSNAAHPGFPALLMQYNSLFVSQAFLEQLSDAILNAIQKATIVTDETVEEQDVEDEPFSEVHVDWSDETEQSVWETPPFNLGEIIEGTDEDE